MIQRKEIKENIGQCMFSYNVSIIDKEIDIYYQVMR